MHQEQNLWHETIVLVLDGESGDTAVRSSQSCGKVPSISITDSDPMPNIGVNHIPGLCDMIEAAKCHPMKLALVLTEDRKIGTIPAVEGTLVLHQDTQVITLGDILSRSISRNNLFFP